MKRSRVIMLSGFALAAVLIAAAIGVTVTGDGTPADPAAAEASSAVPAVPDGSAAGSTPSGSPTDPDAPASPDATGDATERPGEAGDTGAGSTPGDTSTAPALPPSKPLSPLFTGPPPESATELGALVDGFPAVITLAPKSLVEASSVSSSGDIVQVTLAATSAASPPEVLSHYQTSLAGQGLASSAAPSVGSSTALAFIRGADAITLTVTPAGADGSQYTIFAVFSTAG